MGEGVVRVVEELEEEDDVECRPADSPFVRSSNSSSSSSLDTAMPLAEAEDVTALEAGTR